MIVTFIKLLSGFLTNSIFFLFLPTFTQFPGWPLCERQNTKRNALNRTQPSKKKTETSIWTIKTQWQSPVQRQCELIKRIQHTAAADRATAEPVPAGGLPTDSADRRSSAGIDDHLHAGLVEPRHRQRTAAALHALHREPQRPADRAHPAASAVLAGHPKPPANHQLDQPTCGRQCEQLLEHQLEQQSAADQEPVRPGQRVLQPQAAAEQQCANF